MGAVMRVLVFFTLTIAMLGAHADKGTGTLKNAQFNAKGVGLVRIKHENIGEPIAQPEGVEVFVTCTNSKRTITAGAYRTCKFEEYSYEEGVKTLTLRLVPGRVDDNGRVICDRLDIKTIDLSSACKDK